MSSDSLEGLRSEYVRIAGLIDASHDAADRAVAKADIVSLFRRTESLMDEVSGFKESIRQLIDRFKAVPEQPAAVSVRHDHIGASTFVERGWTELAGGNWTAAESMLRKAVELDSTSQSGWALLAWSVVHQGRLDEGMGLCQRVVARDSSHGLAQVAIGMVCLRKGIVGEAIEHLSRVVATGGDARAVLYANYWLGVAYLEREMYEDSIEFLRRALAAGPNLSEAWAALGTALWFYDRPAEAREAWQLGSGVRYSPHAARCAELLRCTTTGGAPPRRALD